MAWAYSWMARVMARSSSSSCSSRSSPMGRKLGRGEQQAGGPVEALLGGGDRDAPADPLDEAVVPDRADGLEHAVAHVGVDVGDGPGERAADHGAEAEVHLAG